MIKCIYYVIMFHMSDEGLLKASTVTRLPDMNLIRDKEFNALIDRNRKVADAVLGMGKKNSQAIGDVLNREDRRWNDLIDVPEAAIAKLKNIGEALGAHPTGTLAWKEAKSGLLSLLEAA